LLRAANAFEAFATITWQVSPQGQDGFAMSVNQQRLA
jgi:hypothetical protein